MSSESRKARLFYHRLPEFWRKQEKLDFLSANTLDTVNWQRLSPNQKNTWLRSDTEDEFDAYLPIGSKEAKRAKPDQAETIFKTYSGGVKTNRDIYVYDFDYNPLAKRIKRFVEDYNSQVDKYKRQNPKPNIDDFVDYENIGWSHGLKLHLRNGRYAQFQHRKIKNSLYRPYSRKLVFFDRVLIEATYLQPYFFPNEQSEAENRLICLTDVAYRSPSVSALVVNSIPNLSICSTTDSHQCFPFYTYDEDGSNRRENITDYALNQFRAHYNDPDISKWDIFYYVYGLLHHPGYRQRYALDLKRNLPRIPFVPSPPTPSPGPDASAKGSQSAPTKSLPEASGRDLGWGWQKGTFHAFSRAGKQLADLHLNYEFIERHELDWQAERTPISYRVEKMLPKGKVDSEHGNYKVFSSLKYNDSLTLHDIPERAFAYRLGNRSALEWIIDQYRVKTDKRSGITHDPNGYSDDEKYILHLIERIITVSLRTVDIVEQLANLPFREIS